MPPAEQTVECEATPGRALEHWRHSRRGFAPLYCESVVAAAITFLLDGLRPGARVLDLGSGEGQVSEALAAAGCAPVALDVHRPWLLGTGVRDRVAARAEGLPFRDASVDAIYCFSVLQYTDRLRALDEMQRVLRPGGRFAVIENLDGSPWARTHRVLKRVTGERDSDHLAPRRHLRWADRGEYESRFASVACQPHDLVSPMLLLSAAFYHAPADLPPGSPRRRVRKAFERMDRFLLDGWGAAAHASWLALVIGRR